MSKQLVVIIGLALVILTVVGCTKEKTNIPALPKTNKYTVEFEKLNNIQPNEPAEVKFKIISPKGEVVKKFEVEHEKIMHLILVRKDLQYFQHLHPNFNQSTGEFSLNIEFPAIGPYRFFPDFTSGEDNPQKQTATIPYDINIGDFKTYTPTNIVTDSNTIKNAEEYQIEYSFPTELISQKKLSYTLTIKQNGQEVTDLEPYLGARGHGIILNKDTLDFIHTHTPSIDSSGKHNMAMDNIPNQNSKSQISFEVEFPKSGIYKVFTQFQHKGKVITTDFVVNVK